MVQFPLRQLKAQLYKIVKVESTEVEQKEDGCVGKFLFRDDDGQKFLWSDRPYRYELRKVELLAEAQEIMFLCPACYAKNSGEVGTHRVLVSFADRGVPDEAGSVDSTGKPSRWNVVSGTSLDDLVLTPSILLDASRPADQGCHWHGFVGSSGISPGHAG